MQIYLVESKINDPKYNASDEIKTSWNKLKILFPNLKSNPTNTNVSLTQPLLASIQTSTKQSPSSMQTPMNYKPASQFKQTRRYGKYTSIHSPCIYLKNFIFKHFIFNNFKF